MHFSAHAEIYYSTEMPAGQRRLGWQVLVSASAETRFRSENDHIHLQLGTVAHEGMENARNGFFASPMKKAAYDFS
jgi:hypothetical protein